MNFALAKEIYGIPWCMDAISFQSLSAVLTNIRNGVVLETPEIKYNSPYLLNVNNETRVITRPFGNEWDPGQLENNDKFEGVGVVSLDGAITLSGGNSSIGMEQLSSMMFKMAQDDRIKGFVIRTNSGGGASGAVQVMTDTINEIKKTKPVYTSIKKGGMAGSAAYGIISPSNKIFSEDNMNIVGSIGTMIQFEGKAANVTDKDGTKNIRLYATKSTSKNKAFEEALNNDNYELIINELLDPINENFIAQTLANRPQLLGSNFDDGHTVFSKDAIGTFIDGIASFDEVVNMVLNDSKIKNSININSNKMNKESIKNEHPTVYNEIVNEGVISERERVSSWMVYASADSEMVTTGIESGLSISPSQREKLMVKMHSIDMLGNLQSDSAKPLVTAESETVIPETIKEDAEVNAAFNFELK
jgi:ClpP class serine protease